MERKLLVYSECVDEMRRVQFGEFSQTLADVDALFLSALTFAHGVERAATLGMLCPNREIELISSVVASCGGRIETSSSPRRKRVFRHFGSTPVMIEGLNEQSLACFLRSLWDYSPLVWGIRTEGAPASFDLWWLEQGIIPPACFADQWSDLFISFYHGAWIALYGGANEQLSVISKIGRAFGYKVEHSLVPL